MKRMIPLLRFFGRFPHDAMGRPFCGCLRLLAALVGAVGTPTC